MARRRTYTPDFKARVVLEMLTEGMSLAEASRKYGIKDSVLSRWRQQFIERAPSERAMANQELLEQIKTVHRESDKTYDSPRIYQALLRLGRKCSRNRVARLMRRNGIQAKQKRCFRSTTKRNKVHPVAPNLLKLDLTADRPDQKWLADTHALACRASVS